MFGLTHKAAGHTLKSKRILALGAALAITLTTGGVALAANSSFAATTENVAGTSGTASVGTSISSTLNYSGLAGNTTYVVVSKLVYVDNGQDVAPWVGSEITTPASGIGSYTLMLPVPAAAAGRKVVAFDYVYPAGSVAAGTKTAPTAIKAGVAPILSIADINNVNKTIYISPTTGGTTTTSPAPIVTTPVPGQVGTASVGTSVTTQVNYSGLTAGTKYQVISKLVYKDTGADVAPWVGKEITIPSTGSGSYSLQLPIPAAAAGREIVVFDYIFPADSIAAGTVTAPTAIKAGVGPVWKSDNLATATKIIKVLGTAVTTPPTTTPTTPVTTPPAAAPCYVSGFVFKDANKNGTKDAGEAGVAGVAADLRSIADNVYPGTFVKSTITDVNGFYKFEIAGANCARFFVDFNESQYPANWSGFVGGDSDLKAGDFAKGWSNPFSMSVGQNFERLDAGLRENAPAVTTPPVTTPPVTTPPVTTPPVTTPPVTTPPVTTPPVTTPPTTTPTTPAAAPCVVSGHLWNDANSNSRRDAGEAGVANVTVDLRAIPNNVYPGTIAATTKTDANGFYSFTRSGADCTRFFVDFNETQYPAGFTGFGGGDSDMTTPGATGGWTFPFNLSQGQTFTGLDAGLRAPAAASPSVVLNWPASTAGTKVDLHSLDGRGVVARGTIDANGNLTFNNVANGNYWVYYRNYNNGNFPQIAGGWAYPVSGGIEGGTAHFTVNGGAVTIRGI